MQIKNENATTFSVDNQKYIKGDYAVDYRGNSGVRIINKFTQQVIGTTNDHTLWTKFRDADGESYPDYETFNTDLINIISKTEAETNIANDKGTVTQATSKTTAVTLSKLNGVVTTVALTDAAAGTFAFDVNNTKVTAASNVQVTAQYAGAGNVHVKTSVVESGKFTVSVTNIGSVALNAALKIHFVVL